MNLTNLGPFEQPDGSILGRAKRKTKKRPNLARIKALLLKRKQMQAAQAAIKKARAKRPAIRSVWSRLSAAKRKALIAAWIKKNPKAKRSLVIAMLKKRLAERQSGAVTSPGAVQATPTPALSPTIITQDPASAPIPTEETTPVAQAVEEEQEQGVLDSAANEEGEAQDAAENAAEDIAEDTATKAEQDAEEMTEPTAEERQEEAQEASSDAAEAIAETSGDLLLGFLRGKRNMRRRHLNHVHKAIRKAAPMAGEIERLSGGEIQANHLLGAVKLIAKAKKGDPKAKKGIKAVTKMAAKKGPKQAKAKKAKAKLKIAHQIMKKTGTAKGGKKPVPFNRPVIVRNQGLKSYSAYQRGMATIPGYARSYYGG